MDKRSGSTRQIKDMKQLEALASPARQEIIDTLEAGGPSSAAELGALLGRAPDSLYFHLKRLEDAGLVKRSDRDIGRGRTEAVFEPAGRDMRLAPEAFTPAKADAMARLTGAMMRITARDLENAVVEGLANVHGKRCNYRAGRMKAWLTGAQLQDINSHIDAIMEIMRTGERPKGSALHAMTFAMAPVAPSERATTDPP